MSIGDASLRPSALTAQADQRVPRPFGEVYVQAGALRSRQGTQVPCLRDCWGFRGLWPGARCGFHPGVGSATRCSPHSMNASNSTGSAPVVARIDWCRSRSSATRPDPSPDAALGGSASTVGLKADGGGPARQLRDSLRPRQGVFSGVERAFGPKTVSARSAEAPCKQPEFGSIDGRGGIRTPETRITRLTVFKTAAFNRSATLPRLGRCYADSAPSYTGIPTAGRGGRVAEGTRLLSEYGDQTPSRVRIPPSPFR
jgi:hypothetical protein